MNSKILKNKSKIELIKMIEILKTKLFSLKFKNKLGKLHRTHKIFYMKKI